MQEERINIAIVSNHSSDKDMVRDDHHQLLFSLGVIFIRRALHIGLEEVDHIFYQLDQRTD